MRRPPVGDHEGRPFGYGYEPPTIERGRPAVITWFRVYAATTVVVYAIAFLALCQFLTPAVPNEAYPTVAESTTVLVLGLLLVAFSGLFAVAALVPYKPWGWTVALIAICLGLSSCSAIAALPLLIYWMKPATKAAFGRL